MKKRFWTSWRNTKSTDVRILEENIKCFQRLSVDKTKRYPPLKDTPFVFESWKLGQSPADPLADSKSHESTVNDNRQEIQTHFFITLLHQSFNSNASALKFGKEKFSLSLTTSIKLSLILTRCFRSIISIERNLKWNS